MSKILPIEVGHIKYDRDQHGVYVGRTMPGLQGSLLGNPFKITATQNREQVVAKYRQWLWQQIQAKGEVYEAFQQLLEQAESQSCTCLPC